MGQSELSQGDLFEHVAERKILDQLLSDSKLYKKSRDYMELLDFVAKLRNFAPFNGMLLQIQKPGLSYAATKHDWHQRFGRYPNEHARPLLIMWPFGPVALVYDVVDTEGAPLPEDARFFNAIGPINREIMIACFKLLERQQISTSLIDVGDSSAGSIRVTYRADKESEERKNNYGVCLNRNHEAPVQFATLLHELGHLFLGHLGPDKALSIADRSRLPHEQRELEAESVSYVLCERFSLQSRSKTYLADYVEEHTTVDDLDIYQVMKAAGQVESILKPATKQIRSEQAQHSLDLRS